MAFKVAGCGWGQKIHQEFLRDYTQLYLEVNTDVVQGYGGMILAWDMLFRGPCGIVMFQEMNPELLQAKHILQPIRYL